MPKSSIPRIEHLRVKNYRALCNIELKFLSECFTIGLRKAWDRRGRFRELRTRGEEGYIIIELK
jgi:hypothetical protein